MSVAPASARPPRAELLVTAALAAVVGWLAAVHPLWLAPRLPADLAGAVLLVAGLAAVAVLWVRPAAGAPLLVAFVYLNLSQVLVRHFEVPSLLRVLVLMLAVVAWRTAGPRTLRAIVREPLTAALALATAVTLASTLWAVEPALADARFWELAKAFLLYALVATLAASPEALRRVAWTIALGGAALGGLGVWQHLTGAYAVDFWGLARVKHAQIYGEVFEPRIAGPLGDPNFFAQILLLALPLAVALAWREARPGLRLAAGGAALLIGPAILLTFSRGAGLALAAQVALLIALSRRRLRAAAAAGAALLLLALLAPAELGRRLTTFGELLPGREATVIDPDSSFEERRLVTRAAWEMFRSQPLAGVGAGNYTAHYTRFADRVGSPERFYDAPGEVHYPHSLYLEVAAETGALGLAAFALVLASAGRALIAARRAFAGRGAALPAALATGVGIALAGYLVSSLFLHGHFLRYLWLLFGLAAALRVAAAEPGGDDAA